MEENHAMPDQKESRMVRDLPPQPVTPSSGAEMRPPAGTRKKCTKRSSLEEEDFLGLLHGSDPVKIELYRLENELRDKDRELSEAHCEIKALKLTERAKEKALAEVTEELAKMVEKYQASEAALENKNLEVKRIIDEKKEALVAQFAAEATLRRVHAAQKDEELPPLEAILSPLEAEIKVLRQEVSKLQDDNKALERLTKSKEVALLDVEREVQFARIKAAHVDDLQNRNRELIKQNEICQEEYKILDKMHRQKVAEVEKLGQTVHELEEALLSGAAAANAVRDYQRQVSELKGEKKTLERTLSRAKVTENRVAVVVANEWKDANDKVMPVKQWLEERRLLMGEMQQLRDRLSISERSAKTEGQLKEKFQLRLKILEGSLKASIPRGCSNGMRHDHLGADDISKFSSIGTSIKKSPLPLIRSASLSRHSTRTLMNARGVSKSFDGGAFLDEAQCRTKSFVDAYSDLSFQKSVGALCTEIASNNADEEPNNGKPSDQLEGATDDFVPGILYEVLQKEVIALRKACQEKVIGLKEKDGSIEMLSKKVETLTKAMEIEAKKKATMEMEAKKIRREKVAVEKDLASMRAAEKEHEQKAWRLKGMINNVHS